MAIYAYGEPRGNQQFISASLVNEKISRFLWSWFDNCDLNRLRNVPEYRMTADEQKAWSKGQQLLYFRPGDWVIHKHIPKYGQMTAARLSSEYFYQNPLPAPWKDGRHCFRVDKVVEFTNDYTKPGLHKVLYNEIAGKQGSLYRVTCDREFYETIIALKVKLKDETEFKLDDVDRRNIKAFGGISKKVFDSRWENHFRREFFELLERNKLFNDVVKISKRYPDSADAAVRNRAYFDLFERNGILGDLRTIIQRSHPRKILEGFVAKVLREIYHDFTVFENGSGWKSDHGADLIVGNSIVGTSIIYRPMVVQVKSFNGLVSDKKCVEIINQIEEAINYYKAVYGRIITTGYSTPVLEEAIAKLAIAMNTKIDVIAGDDFAGWVLKNTGLDLLF